MDFQKIMDFFGLNESASEEPEIPDSKEVREKIVSINKKQDIKLNFHRPESYDEVKQVTDIVKSGRPLILNLEELDVDTGRRFVDFVSGAVYALNGRVIKAGKGVFVFTPGNIDIEGKGLGEVIKDSLIRKNRT
ncbi:MAG: cell division protein SepF [Halanaerobiales bacterium]